MLPSLHHNGMQLDIKWFARLYVHADFADEAMEKRRAPARRLPQGIVRFGNGVAFYKAAHTDALTPERSPFCFG